MSTEERVSWAWSTCRAVALSSSFGAQAAVSLHLVTRQLPSVPVILIDTGYLFPETYRFIDDRRSWPQPRVYQSAGAGLRRHGAWEKGIEGIEHCCCARANPCARDDRPGVGTVCRLARQQARSRSQIAPLEHREGRWKVHPIFDWSDRQIFDYLRRHDLPYHPLWHEGYVSIGDWHTTRSLAEAGDVEATRFFGLKRECGLHGLEG
jgi:phosphoadenosine phosphosulfate reductase